MEMFNTGVGKRKGLAGSWKFGIRKKWQRSWEGSKFSCEAVTWGIWFGTGSQRCRFGVNAEVTYRLKKRLHGQDILLSCLWGEMRSQLRPLLIGISPGEGVSLQRGRKASKEVTGCGRRWGLDWEAWWVSLGERSFYIHCLFQGTCSFS